jgi:HSP20 family molecular chaperone IbpA
MAFKATLLPGTGLGDLAVSSDGELLTVRVEKTEMNEDAGDDYNQVDWRRETFTRIAPLPGEVQSTDPVVNYEDGVLTLTFPKK